MEVLIPMANEQNRPHSWHMSFPQDVKESSRPTTPTSVRIRPVNISPIPLPSPKSVLVMDDYFTSRRVPSSNSAGSVLASATEHPTTPSELLHHQLTTSSPLVGICQPLAQSPSTPMGTDHRASFSLSPVEEPETFELFHAQVAKAQEYDLGLPPTQLERTTSLTTESMRSSSSTLQPLADDSQPVSVSKGSESTASSTGQDMRRSCSLPTLIDHQEDAVTLMRQMSEAALTDTFGSSTRLNVKRVAARSERRYRALEELVSSEQHYLQDLHILSEIYFANLHRLATLSAQSQAVLKRSIDDIAKIHERIGCQIEQVAEDIQWKETYRVNGVAADNIVLQALLRIADIFTAEAKSLSVYSDWCSRQHHASLLVRELEQNDVKWQQYCSHCSSLIEETFSTENAKRQKLSLNDYMIKPVQRICRYPMLFRQLGNTLDAQNPLQQKALESVRAAVAAVSEAAQQVDDAEQASSAERRGMLISSRIVLPTASMPLFRGTLGPVSLVGTLYVIHVSSPDPLKAKYCGILLYPTHLVMVTLKKGSTAEYLPRHWLPLRMFDIQVLSDEDALLKNSFRMKHKNHVFEFSAPSVAGRDIWFNKIEQVAAARREAWWRAFVDNPATPPWDESSISSVDIDSSVDTNSSRHPRSESLLQSETNTASGPGSLSPKLGSRSKQNSTSVVIKGDSASTRSNLDAALADIISPECATARITADREARETQLVSRGSILSLQGLRPKMESRNRPLTYHPGGNEFKKAHSRSGSGHSRSGSVIRHKRRSSSEAILTTDRTESGSANDGPLMAPFPSTGLVRSKTGFEGSSSWRGTFRNRAMSSKSPNNDVAILRDEAASVNRNGSTSSSSNSSHGAHASSSSASSAPPSPLVTPKDTFAPFDAIPTFSLRSFASRWPLGPAPGSVEPDGQTNRGAGQLYKQSNTSFVALASRMKKDSSSSLRSRRQSSMPSLFSYFSPQLSPTIQSPAEPMSPASPESVTVVLQEEPSDMPQDEPKMSRSSTVQPEAMPLPRKPGFVRQRSIRAFKALTKMSSTN